MKVTHVFWSLGFGGIETMLVNIANEQMEAGANVSIIIINELYEQSLVDSLNQKINLVFLNRKKGAMMPWFIINLNWILARINPDVIHLHRSNLYNIIWYRKFKNKICTTLHDLPKGSVRHEGVTHILWRKIKKTPVLACNVTDIDRIPHVFAISEVVQKALYENYNIKSTVVCNGIVTLRFATRSWRIPDGRLRIVMVSRMEHEKKGQDLLIRAMAALQGAVTVDFIGIGPSMEYLKQLTVELNVGMYVRFLGKQTQDYVATHLADYDLFVQPSRWEGFGLTVAEAMAARVPVLVSKGQGPAEVTCGDYYGWTFTNGDAEDLVRQIRFIMDHYADAMIKADEAQSYVHVTYDVNVTAHRYLYEYRHGIMN